MSARPFRDWWADRIAVGWAVQRVWPSEEYRPTPTHCYVIKHRTFVWYMRDPYMLRDNSGDPRKQWGQLRQAYRFPTKQAAESCLQWQEHDGIIEAVELI